jgi:hypothetical protein
MFTEVSSFIISHFFHTSVFVKKVILGHVSHRIYRGFPVTELYASDFEMRGVIVCAVPGFSIIL